MGVGFDYSFTICVANVERAHCLLRRIDLTLGACSLVTQPIYGVLAQ
jgi:hypothetical protein